MMTAPGVVLSSRYRLGRRIAVGGMGEVWAADDLRLARIVAVKILRAELTGDPEFVDRFRTEARITASLNHPGVAAVYDYGEAPGGTAYLVMELVAGEALSAVLARAGRLSAPRTLDVLHQTGRALHEAHRRSLVHRDIKPGNLLITPDGQVKVTDFGIAKVAHQIPVTRTGLVMGTAQYISPEQASGQEAVPASDIYSLGVVAYECLTGGLPFPHESAVATALAHVRDAPLPLPAEVPPAVSGLVMRMLIKDPAGRYVNGAALVRAVDGVRSGPGQAHRAPSRTGASRPTRVAPVATVPRAAARVIPASAGVVRTRSAPVPRHPAPPAGQLSGPIRQAPPAAVGGQGGHPPPVYRRQTRRLGLSVFLAVTVLVLAALALLLIDQLAGRAFGATGLSPQPTGGGVIEAASLTQWGGPL